MVDEPLLPVHDPGEVDAGVRVRHQQLLDALGEGHGIRRGGDNVGIPQSLGRRWVTVCRVGGSHCRSKRTEVLTIHREGVGELVSAPNKIGVE